MFSKCPPSLNITYRLVSSAAPRSSISNWNNEKRGEDLGDGSNQRPFGRPSLPPSSASTRGLASHHPSRTLKIVIRKAVAGLLWNPMLGLAAAPEIAAAVLISMPGDG